MQVCRRKQAPVLTVRRIAVYARPCSGFDPPAKDVHDSARPSLSVLSRFVMWHASACAAASARAPARVELRARGASRAWVSTRAWVGASCHVKQIRLIVASRKNQTREDALRGRQCLKRGAALSLVRTCSGSFHFPNRPDPARPKRLSCIAQALFGRRTGATWAALERSSEPVGSQR